MANNKEGRPVFKDAFTASRNIAGSTDAPNKTEFLVHTSNFGRLPGDRFGRIEVDPDTQSLSLSEHVLEGAVAHPDGTVELYGSVQTGKVKGIKPHDPVNHHEPAITALFGSHFRNELYTHIETTRKKSEHDQPANPNPAVTRNIPRK